MTGPVAWTRLGSGLRMIGPGVVDSGLISVRNFALGVIAARSLALADFGRMSTAVLVLLLATGCSKALHSDPFMLASTGGGRRRAASGALGATLSLGLVLGGFGLVAGLALRATSVSPSSTAIVLAASAVLPFVLLSDTARWLAHARGRGWHAVAGTTVGLVVSVAAAVCAANLSRLDGPGPLTLAWGLGAVPAAGYLLVALRLSPAPRQFGSWYSENRGWCLRLLTDWALIQVTAEGVFVLIAALTSATEIGELRKAQLPLAPIVVLTTGLTVFLQPALARARERAAPVVGMRRMTVRLAWLAGAATGAYSLAVLLVPMASMEALVGGEWAAARPYVVPLGLALVAGAVAAPLGIGLRVFGSLGDQVRLRLLVAPVGLVVTALAALGAGALAATWCVAATTVTIVALWLRLLSRVQLDERPADPAEVSA